MGGGRMFTGSLDGLRRCLAGVAIVAVALAGLMVFAMVDAQPAAAHQDPAGCTANGLNTVLTVSPAGSVQDGTTLTYTISYSNNGASACNITAVNASLTLPDTTFLTILTGATLNVGATITCPGGAGCAAGPYTYVVKQADETGPATRCPPTPGQATLPRVVTAVAVSTGTLHSVSGDGDSAQNCKTISVVVVRQPNAVTAIHTANHAVVTSVQAGTTVHDSVTVTDPDGFGQPTGTVTFSWFTNKTCTAPADSTDTKALASGGVDD